MSCERGESSVPRNWLQQDKVRPRSVYVGGELKWELGRRERPDLQNTRNLMNGTQPAKAPAVVREFTPQPVAATAAAD